MSDTWYLAVAGEPVGPFSLAEFQAELHSRTDWKSILVWKDGFTDWKVAGSVEELRLRPPPIPPATIAQRKPSTPMKSEQPEPIKQKSFLSKAAAWVLVIVVTLVAMVIGKQVGREGYRAVSSAVSSTPKNTESAIEAGFAKAVLEAKAQLPKQVDKATTLMNVTSLGTTLTYHYTVDSVMYEVLPAFTEEVRKTTVEKICAADTMVKTMRAGAVYRYTYNDSFGKHIGSFDVRSGSCS